MRTIAGTTLFSLALVASACGGSSSQPAASAAASQAAATAAATTAATSAPTAAPTAAATADQDKALLDLLRTKAAAYKVTYNFAMAGGTTSSDQIGTLTQIFKAPFYRTDMTLTVGGKTQTISTIIRTEGTFTCGAFISATGGCYQFAGASGAALAPQAPTSVPTDLAGWNLVPTTSKNVAGTDTRCFTFTGPATSTQTAGQSVTATGCYTSQGVPLYISSRVGTIESTMTATQFSTSVTDADFALPYPVQKFPGQP